MVNGSISRSTTALRLKSTLPRFTLHQHEAPNGNVNGCLEGVVTGAGCCLKATLWLKELFFPLHRKEVPHLILALLTVLTLGSTLFGVVQALDTDEEAVEVEVNNRRLGGR